MKKNAFTLLLIAIATSFTVNGKEVIDDLNVNKLSDSIKKNADMVIRYANTEIEMIDLTKIKQTQKYAITILNKRAEGHKYRLETYDKLVSINQMSATIYDSTGKEVKSLKEKDAYDRSSYGMSISAHDDSRIKVFTYEYTQFPQTIVVEVVKTYKSTFVFPSWIPQPTASCAVESASLSVQYPTGIQLLHKENLLPSNVKKSETTIDGKVQRLTWEVNNMLAYVAEENTNAQKYTFPIVQFKTNEFEVFGYKGSMNSWNDFGKFFHLLNKDRDVLPQEKESLVRSLVGNETDTLVIVQKLYQYLQKNTRYLLNAFGVAGWQTFDANHVSKNGYGDCKGLTNYLKSMLKVVGIPSFEALVYAGSGEYYSLEPDFVINSFNHVILCVPQKRDTIWVECTSQELPAGYLGSFTQNRKVLLLTPDGGVVTKTPHYGNTNNFINRHFTINVTDLNTEIQKVAIHNTYSGMKQDRLLNLIKTKSEKEVKDYTNGLFSFPSYSIKSYAYTPQTLPGKTPSIDFNAELEASGILSGTRKRTFLNLGWGDNPMQKIDQINERKRSFVLDASFITTDTILVTLPEGMNVESMPKAMSISKPFAKFDLQAQQQGDAIVIVRKFEQKEGVFEANLFSEYVEMYQAIKLLKENTNIVLLNKVP